MKRLLVIEDHKMFSSYISELVVSVYPQARVFQAKDGREGIDLALAEKPDVILLDMHMPVMDGYETARALREMPETSHIPLVAMTLMMNEQSQTLVNFRRFCDAIIFKPFQATHLEAAMQEIGVQ